MKKNDFIIIFTTVNSDSEANRIGQKLIEERLAACVSIIPSVTSIFRWEGKISSESEQILIIKTQKKYFSKIREKILSIHTYNLPEIISVPITDGSEQYLKWVEEQLQDIST